MTRYGSTRIDAAVLDSRERAGLVAVRALGRSGLRVGAFDTADAPAFSSRWTTLHGLLDDYGEDAGAYARGVAELVERHGAHVVIPVHDGSIEALKNRREDLAPAALALANDEPLEIALDKRRTFDLAADLEIALPRMADVDDAGDAPAAVRELGLPLVVKPLRSWVDGFDHRHTSVVVESVTQLEVAVAAMTASGVEFTVQEWAPGRREAIWLFYADGTIWARCAQVAYRTFPPLGGVSVLRETIALPGDAALEAERLVREIGLEGFSEVEFRRDRAGAPLLMEINPRLSASIELAGRAGIDFPRLIYAWAAGERLERSLGYRAGVRMRWLGGDVRWLREVFRREPGPDTVTRLRGVAAFAGAFLRPSGYDYLSMADPLPAVHATSDFLLRGLGVRQRSRRRRVAAVRAAG